MKALLKNYPQSPRKVRLVADLIRGKSVPAARAALLYLPKKSSPTIGKLLDSAIANASSRGNSAENLFVKTITVTKEVQPQSAGLKETNERTASYQLKAISYL